ncbi:hypothetical protein Hanom_Chr04g00322751 [Helianthus anomalus]
MLWESSSFSSTSTEKSFFFLDSSSVSASESSIHGASNSSNLPINFVSKSMSEMV